MNAPIADFLPRLGQRVLLRRLTISDLENFQAYRSDPDVGRFQGWRALSSTEAAAFLSEMNTAEFGAVGEWFQLGIVDRRAGQLIGDVGICLRRMDDPHAEIGFTVAAKSQRQGLGSEAVREVLAMLFEHTRVARVIAITDSRNLATARLLTRVGMSLSETVSAVFRGEPCTEQVFVISRHEASSRPIDSPSIVRTAPGSPMPAAQSKRRAP